MILSQTAVYAVKAVLHLAEAEGEDLVRVDDIADALGVPRNYLSKVLHALVRAGLLASTRGPRGGFRLAVDASKLTLGSVVDPFDGVLAESACLLDTEGCGDVRPCVAHTRWKDVSSAVSSFFRETTVQDLRVSDDVENIINT